jgi:hypothetical protein
MRRLPLLLGPLLGAAAARAGACELAPPVAHTVDPAEQAADHAPPVMGQRVRVNITRGRGKAAGCEGGTATSCDDIARVELTPEATDDRTPAAQLGYQIEKLTGPLPAGLVLPAGAVRAGSDGAIVLAWSEHPDGDPPLLAFVLGVRAVDAGGNASAPIQVPVRDGEDELLSCGLGVGNGKGKRTSARGSALPALGLVALVALGRRRRR